MNRIIALLALILIFATKGKNKKVKNVTITQPTADHDGKKIPLAVGNRVRVRGVGTGVVIAIGFRVHVQFDNDKGKGKFFKSLIIRL